MPFEPHSADARLSSCPESTRRARAWVVSAILAATASPLLATADDPSDARFKRAMETFSRRVAEPTICREIRSPEGDGLAALGTSNCCELPGHGGAGCDDSACSDYVCFELDSFCCLEWDDTCVEIANEVCDVCGGSLCGGSTENCCTGNPNKPPKCEDPDCCALVCELDPPCCVFNWDAQCRTAANDLCSVCNGGLGDCCTAHDGVSCADTACAATVCAVDPFCCGEDMGTWDAACVEAAIQECAPSACPRTLTVTRTGLGTGTLDGPGIACESDCTETYDYGTLVSLAANPTGGSVFTGWSDDCSGTEGCDVTMDADHAVTGNIDPGPQALTVVVDGAGSGSVTDVGTGGTDIDCPGDCTESYPFGTLVSLAATPSGSDVFAGWSGDCTGTAGCTVTMDQARNVTATFDPPDQTLTVAVAGGGTGTITATGIACPGDCTESYPFNSLVSLTATPTDGSTFAGWTGDCSGDGACQVTMDQARSVTGTFDPPPPQDLTVAVDGTGAGTVTDVGTGGTDINCPGDCTESYPFETMVSLTATPSGSDLFAGWSGDCTGTAGCTVTMDQARGVTATFDPPDQTLTVAVAGSGTGTITGTGIACPGDCSQDYPYGTMVSLTANPTGGSIFVEWTGDCTGSTTCQVTMDQARSVTATFDPPPPQGLTVVVDGAGSGSVTDDATSGTAIDCPGDCSESYAYGTAVDLTATPDPGSLFDGWSDDCAAAGTDPACQVTMTASRTATATFSVDPNVFGDGFESGDLCAWTAQVGGPACPP